MGIEERLRADLKQAMRDHDEAAKTVIRSVIGEIGNRKIAKGAKDVALTDDEAMRVVQKAVKQRDDSAAEYRRVGSTDRAEHEEWESAFLGRYLPAAVTEDEMRAAVDEAITGGAANIGAVMKAVRPKLAATGKLVDGRALSTIAKDKLAAK